MSDDCISRQAAIDAVKNLLGSMLETDTIGFYEIEHILFEVPSAQPETCEGCKHLGKWENEVEYGYSSPCTRCKRRVVDHYER